VAAYISLVSNNPERTGSRTVSPNRREPHSTSIASFSRSLLIDRGKHAFSGNMKNRRCPNRKTLRGIDAKAGEKSAGLSLPSDLYHCLPKKHSRPH